MDLIEKVIIKVQFNDEIRKMPVHNEEITYDELLLMMERVFKHKLNTSDDITIKYKDEDGDLITLSDDSDLIFALSRSSVLKLVLTVNEPETEKFEKSLTASEIVAIKTELQIIRDRTNKLLDKLNNVHIDTHAVEGSGRNSAICGDYQGVGGKEFDPLSANSQQNVIGAERAESSVSINSNTKHEDKPSIPPIQETPDNNRMPYGNSMPVRPQQYPVPQHQQLPSSTMQNVSGPPYSSAPSGMQMHTQQGGMPINASSGTMLPPSQMPLRMPPPSMNMPPTISRPLTTPTSSMTNAPGGCMMPPMSSSGGNPHMPPNFSNSPAPNVGAYQQPVAPPGSQDLQKQMQPGGSIMQSQYPGGSQPRPGMPPPSHMGAPSHIPNGAGSQQVRPPPPSMMGGNYFNPSQMLPGQQGAVNQQYPQPNYYQQK